MLSQLLIGLRRRKHAKQRSQNLDAVQKLGFKAKVISALGQRKLYALEDAEGNVYDNNGAGYASSAGLLAAAQEIIAANPEA